MLTMVSNLSTIVDILKLILMGERLHEKFLISYFCLFIPSLLVTDGYESCLLDFGIKEQKQILIIENRIIVLQNISH